MSRRAYLDRSEEAAPVRGAGSRRTDPPALDAPMDPARALALQGLAGNTAVVDLISRGLPAVQRCGPQGCGPEGCADDAHGDAQVQRQPAHEHGGQGDTLTAGDPRLEDPGFVICTAFCYLGLPPSAVKDIIQSLLECIFTELRAADEAGYRERFAQAREELAAYSKVRLVAKALRFILHGELIPLVNLTARTRPIRDRIVARLVAAGMTHGGLLAAEAVLRKVVLVADLAIAGGCVTYCGVTQMAQRLTEASEAVAIGLAEGVHALEAAGRGIGQAVGAAIGSAVATAYGSLDPANWRLSQALPAQTRADVAVLGAVLWAQVRPGSPWVRRTPDQTELDAFFANATRPLSTYRVPADLMAAIAAACRATIAEAGGTADVTADHLLAMSPYGLMAFLRDNGLVEFAESPEAYARNLTAQPAGSTVGNDAAPVAR